MRQTPFFVLSHRICAWIFDSQAPNADSFYQRKHNLYERSNHKCSTFWRTTIEPIYYRVVRLDRNFFHETFTSPILGESSIRKISIIYKNSFFHLFFLGVNKNKLYFYLGIRAAGPQQQRRKQISLSDKKLPSHENYATRWKIDPNERSRNFRVNQSYHYSLQIIKFWLVLRWRTWLFINLNASMNISVVLISYTHNAPLKIMK